METSSINEGHVSLLALKAKQVAPLVALVEVSFVEAHLPPCFRAKVQKVFIILYLHH